MIYEIIFIAIARKQVHPVGARHFIRSIAVDVAANIHDINVPVKLPLFIFYS